MQLDRLCVEFVSVTEGDRQEHQAARVRSRRPHRHGHPGQAGRGSRRGRRAGRDLRRSRRARPRVPHEPGRGVPARSSRRRPESGAREPPSKRSSRARGRSRAPRWPTPGARAATSWTTRPHSGPDRWPGREPFPTVAVERAHPLEFVARISGRGHVPCLRVRTPSDGAAVDHHAGPDPRPDRYIHERPHPARCARRALAQRCRVDVGVECDRHTEGTSQPAADVGPLPVRLRRSEDVAPRRRGRVEVDRAANDPIPSAVTPSGPSTSATRLSVSSGVVVGIVATMRTSCADVPTAQTVFVPPVSTAPRSGGWSGVMDRLRVGPPRRRGGTGRGVGRQTERRRRVELRRVDERHLHVHHVRVRRPGAENVIDGVEDVVRVVAGEVVVRCTCRTLGPVRRSAASPTRPRRPSARRCRRCRRRGRRPRGLRRRARAPPREPAPGCARRGRRR